MNAERRRRRGAAEHHVVSSSEGLNSYLITCATHARIEQTASPSVRRLGWSAVGSIACRQRGLYAGLAEQDAYERYGEGP